MAQHDSNFMHQCAFWSYGSAQRSVLGRFWLSCMRDHNYVDEGGAIAAREEAQDVFVKWRGGVTEFGVVCVPFLL